MKHGRYSWSLMCHAVFREKSGVLHQQRSYSYNDDDSQNCVVQGFERCFVEICLFAFDLIATGFEGD